MDEYLFIAMAKLKADRFKREREQRAAAAVAEEPGEKPVETHRHSARTSWFSRGPQWREQS